MSKFCLVVMTSRPDVMQLLFFFLLRRKTQADQKRGGEV